MTLMLQDGNADGSCEDQSNDRVRVTRLEMAQPRLRLASVFFHCVDRMTQHRLSPLLDDDVLLEED